MKIFKYSSLDLEANLNGFKNSNTCELIHLNNNEVFNQKQELDDFFLTEISVETRDQIHNICKINQFDKILIKQWNDSMNNGCFKFKLDKLLDTKFTDGKYSFLITKNTLRYSEKRPSQIPKTECINQPFDDGKFNFTKINQNEILFKLEKESEENSDDYIIINNSPIEFGHILIVPKLNSKQNQVLNEHAIKLGCEVAILSGSNNFFIGFNSINGYASVNQLHLHAYYLDGKLKKRLNPLPIQNIKRAQIVAHNLWVISEEDYFFPAFCFQLSDFKNDLNEFASQSFKTLNYFIQNNIPHNLIWIKARPFNNDSENNEITVKLFIIPVRPCYEFTSNIHFVGFACCELSGHIFVFDDNAFTGVTEEFIIDRANEAKLDKAFFEKIKNDLKTFFQR